MAENNLWNDNNSTDSIIEELASAKAELKLAKAEAQVIKADAEASKAEAEALMAEAEALMAEAKALKAEAEAMISEKKAGSKNANISNRTRASQPTIIASQIAGAEAVSSIEENGKLSKERIVLFPDEYQKLGITNFRASVIKDYVYDETSRFLVNGEYDGKTKKYLLIIIMVYNEQNELIGVDFDERIKDKIRSHKTYSASVTLPNYENISRVEIKIIKDPSLGLD